MLSTSLAWVALSGGAVLVMVTLSSVAMAYRAWRQAAACARQASIAQARTERLLLEVALSFVSMVERRDPTTASHQRRVAQLASRLALELELGEEAARGLHIAGLLHDVGKVAVPHDVLSKTGPLHPTQLAMVREHVRAGALVVSELDTPWPLEAWIAQHHERLDGSGYPLGLAGDRIDVGGRILAVADVVEAMCSHRPHRPSPGLGAALAELRDGAGQRYDPRVVRACVRLFEERRFAFEHGVITQQFTRSAPPMPLLHGVADA